MKDHPDSRRLTSYEYTVLHGIQAILMHCKTNLSEIRLKLNFNRDEQNLQSHSVSTSTINIENVW